MQINKKYRYIHLSLKYKELTYSIKSQKKQLIKNKI